MDTPRQNLTWRTTVKFQSPTLTLYLLLGETAEALAQNLGTLHDVDKRVGVNVIENRTELDHVGTIEGNIEHLALGAFVEASTSDEGAATLDVVDDVVTHGLGFIGNDKHGLVTLHAIDNKVDHLALDKDDDDGVDGQADVTEGHQGAEGDDAIDNHDEGTQGNLGVLVQDHRDDVRAATGRARAENQTDGHAVDDASDDGIQEVIRMEPAAMMGNLDHRFDHRGVNRLHYLAVMDDRIVAPCALEDKGKQEDQRRRNDGLDTELGT